MMNKNLSIEAKLSLLVEEATKARFPSAQISLPVVVQSKDPSFGDYQCNSPMKWGKELGTAPRNVASTIVEWMQAHEDTQKILERIEIAGPGFINMRLRPSFLAEKICDLFASGSVIATTTCPQRVIIDFSSPNVAKEMHVGHLRSTIIGDCLARVFEALGHNVLRLNHIGDWGTAFGMLIAHIRSQPDYSLDRIKTYTLSDLMRLYKESKARFDADNAFKRESQQEVVRLQGGDSTSLFIWRIICDISRKAYKEIYELLDVVIEERGESYYNDKLPKIIDELEEKGLVVVSDGAKCIYPHGFLNREGNPLPLMLQKSDGGYNYDTTDMAAIAQRIREERADRIIYVTDSGQATHFQMIFEAAREAGILNPQKTRVDHVPFGLVLGPDGKKFKTRSGDTERLIDLLQTATSRAEEILRTRNPGWDEKDYKTLAHTLGIGAVKYADLSSHRTSDYVFSYDRMLRFEGNTAAFIMYSYVRTASILRKISPPQKTSLTLEHPTEIKLAKILCQLPETIDEVVETLLPNRLTEYLYTVAETFNAFFRDCRVEGDPRVAERALLVSLTGKVLATGLNLLGIGIPMKM